MGLFVGEMGDCSAMSQTIDILGYVDELIEVGVAANQANIHAKWVANIIDHNLCSKHDLKELELSLKKDMQELQTKLILTFATLLGLGISILGLFLKFT